MQKTHFKFGFIELIRNEKREIKIPKINILISCLLKQVACIELYNFVKYRADLFVNNKCQPRVLLEFLNTFIDKREKEKEKENEKNNHINKFTDENKVDLNKYYNYDNIYFNPTYLDDLKLDDF